MTSLSNIRETNAAFVHLATPAPVAVFVGGTSGIGEAMAHAFARHTKGNSTIIIVGRNKVAAERILAALPSPTSVSGPGTGAETSINASREFVECDAILMCNVDRCTKEILAKHSKINYLVVSTGLLTLSGRDETSEGIDKKLAVHYYARWKFFHDLIPSLKRAKEAGEEGAVMSVLAAGDGGEIEMEDLVLKKTFSVKNAALATPTYNDLMVEVKL